MFHKSVLLQFLDATRARVVAEFLMEAHMYCAVFGPNKLDLPFEFRLDNKFVYTLLPMWSLRKSRLRVSSASVVAGRQISWTAVA